MEDRRFYFENCLRIRTLVDGHYRLRPFILNEEQEQILCAIEEQEYLERPVRIIILKARKVGCSTLIEAVGHHYCQFNSHADAKVVAHLKESTKEIFHITKRYQENLPKSVRTIAPGKTIGTSVIWQHGSRFSVETQGSTDAARGSTPSFVHISELALWWKRRRTTTDEDVLQSQLGAVDPRFGTTVVIESTANGASGAFYNRFWKAYKNEPGNMFKALFFGWQEHYKYADAPRKSDKKLDRALREAYHSEKMELFFGLAAELGYDEFWAKRAIEFELKPKQIRWAIQTLQTKFDGDISRFDTEYPLSPQIAFTSSGKSPFDQVLVAERVAELKESVPDMTTGTEIVAVGNPIKLTPGADHWQIYHQPKKDHVYLVTIDSAHGVDEGDYSCIQVLDSTDHHQAAEYYARVPPDVVAQEAMKAGYSYNDAMMIPEIDGPGLAVVRELLDTGDGYQNIYVRSLSGNWTQKFGFRTGTSGKREAAIAALAKAIRNKSWDFFSKRLLAECQTFIENANGRAEAMPGEHDDAVMAMAIGLYLDSELNDAAISEPIKEVAKDPPQNSVAWLLNSREDSIDPHLGKYW